MKDKYKAMNGSLVSANEILLRYEEKHKVKISNLRARLDKYRKEAKLHITMEHVCRCFVSISSIVSRIIYYALVIQWFISTPTKS